MVTCEILSGLVRAIRGSVAPANMIVRGVGGSEAPSAEDVLDGLNDAQRDAAMRVRGPVAILAGAGTGKTTTITRRIADQSRIRYVRARQRILAVTFTDRAGTGAPFAAGRVGRRRRRRCRGADVRHAAALSQLRWLWPTHTDHPVPAILTTRRRSSPRSRTRCRHRRNFSLPARAGRRDRMGEEPHGGARGLPG